MINVLKYCAHYVTTVFPEEVFSTFSFLRNMFSNEFILCPNATVQVRGHFVDNRAERIWILNFIYFTHICDFKDFEEACFLLEKTGVLQVTQQEVLVTHRGHRTMAFLSRMLVPFIQGYQVRDGLYIKCHRNSPACVFDQNDLLS